MNDVPSDPHDLYRTGLKLWLVKDVISLVIIVALVGLIAMLGVSCLTGGIDLGAH